MISLLLKKFRIKKKKWNILFWVHLQFQNLAQLASSLFFDLADPKVWSIPYSDRNYKRLQKILPKWQLLFYPILYFQKWLKILERWAKLWLPFFFVKYLFLRKKSSKLKGPSMWPEMVDFINRLLKTRFFGVFRLKFLYIGSLYHFHEFWWWGEVRAKN